MFLDSLIGLAGSASELGSIVSDLFGGSSDRDALMDNGYGFMDLSNYYTMLGAEQANKQAKIADSAYSMAQDAWQRYEDKYVPLEDAQIDAALSDIESYQPLKEALVNNTLDEIGLYAPLKEQQVQSAMSSLGRANQLEEAVTEEALRQEQPNEQLAADTASGQVRQTFNQTRKNQDQQLKGLGLDPSHYANLSASLDRDEAATEAAARTSAMETERERADNSNWERLTSGLGLVRSGSDMSTPTYSPMSATTTASNPMTTALDLTNTATSGLSGVQSYYSGLANDYLGLGSSFISKASDMDSGGFSGLLGLFG